MIKKHDTAILSYGDEIIQVQVIRHYYNLWRFCKCYEFAYTHLNRPNFSLAESFVIKALESGTMKII